MRLPSNVYIDKPSFPLLHATISYWAQATANGNVLGTTIVDAQLANEPSYQGLLVKLLDGPAAGQVRPIAAHPAGTNTLTVAAAFTDNTGAVVQILAGYRFTILSISGGGGAPPPVGPSIGLWMFGVCDPGMVASLNTIVCPNLAGFPNDIFNNEFWMQIIHNTSVPGAAPEREIRRITDYVGATGTFTVDAFTANVEANDLLCIFHESIMGIEILAFGTLTLSDLVQPEDNTRTEGNNYFRGNLLMPTEGACRFQPRLITSYTGAGGIFSLDPGNPFTALPGLVDYVIISNQTPFVPLADGTENRLPADVIGNKVDTPIYISDAVSSIMRYLKGNLNATGLVYKGTVTNWVNATQFAALNLAGFGNQAFANGQFFIFAFRDAGGAAAMPQSEWRLLQTYVSATGMFTHEAFSVDLTNGDVIIIIHQSILYPGAVPGYGAFDFSSATVPADSTRAARYAWEVADQFKGMLLMPIMGTCRFIARRIVNFTVVGGIFTIDTNNPFPAPTDTVEYLILNDQTEFVPGADGLNNRTPSDVIGNKVDATTQTIAATTSLVRYIKGIVDSLFTAVGVIAWLARALPAAGIALTRVIRYIAEVKPEWATRASATHTTTGVTEETILTTAYTVPGLFYFNLTLRNMLAQDDFTIRVYKRVDGANYDLKSVQNFIDAPAVKVYEIEGLYTDGTEFIRVTIQRNSGTNRAFPHSYNIIKQAVA